MLNKHIDSLTGEFLQQDIERKDDWLQCGQEVEPEGRRVMAFLSEGTPLLPLAKLSSSS